MRIKNKLALHEAMQAKDDEAMFAAVKALKADGERDSRIIGLLKRNGLTHEDAQKVLAKE